MSMPGRLDRSPDINNLTRHLNCSDYDATIILKYDTAKFSLVDSVIPIMTLIFSVVGLIINFIFIYLTMKGIRERVLPLKGYSLLLNRSFTDVLTSILTLIFVSLHKFDQIPDPSVYPEEYQNLTIYELDYLIPHGRTMFTLLLTLNFWAAAGCYAVLALFMFLAVRHPIVYMVKITSRRTSEAGQHLMSIARMALNIFAFSISCIVMAGFVSIPLFLKTQIDDLNIELVSVSLHYYLLLNNCLLTNCAI
uniref:G_PROTEIN_RECEP_F1_2 domain-containing protein n=1 Tax=Heterorhabditis bacteriophora TaxID=37862 RepID=A0A1I7XAE3_HETBA